MVSMALYGAALTAASGGAMVAIERALGWSRQLRLTPLNPAVYIAHEGADRAGPGRGRDLGRQRRSRSSRAGPRCRSHLWVACAVLTLVCTMVFAALGVFVGYLVPGENAMQVLGPGLALLSFLGNVFIPIDQGSTLWHVAAWTPMFGVAEISRAPLTGDLPWYAVVNAVVWLVRLRRRRRVADEQGHGPGLRPASIR